MRRSKAFIVVEPDARRSCLSLDPDTQKSANYSYICSFGKIIAK